MRRGGTDSLFWIELDMADKNTESLPRPNPLRKVSDGQRELMRRLGYTFRNIAILETAFTSPSLRTINGHGSGESDNQRLEFLGDAVLGMLAAEYLYREFATECEGSLTSRRISMVNRQALTRLANDLELGKCLRMKVQEQAGGRDHDHFLADAAEALFGALWLDGGLPAASLLFQHVKRLYWRHAAQLTPRNENPKGYLQEIAQSKGTAEIPRYTVLEITGPDHNPEYRVQVSLANGASATATGNNKRAAETNAAAALLAKLK